MFDEENTFPQEPVVPEGAAAPQAEMPYSYAEPFQPPKAKKKSKLPLILGIAAAVVIAAAAAVVLLFFGNAGTASATPIESVAVYALMNDDGTAYIPLYDGTCIKINEEVDSAVLTKDRAHVVVLLTDGTLYVTDPQQSQKTTIADNATDLITVRDSGLLYDDEELISHRVTFADFSNVEIGKDVALKSANHTLSVLYATDEGDLYALASSASEAEKVGTFEDTARVKAISDDGQISVWADVDGSNYTIYLSDGGDRTTLGSVTSKYDGVHVEFTKDQQLVVITDSYSDRMWIKAVGTEVVEVKLAGEASGAGVYTAAGKLSDALAGEVTSLYVTTDGDVRSNLYNITLTGDRERVLSKVSKYTVVNGSLFYRDSENNLYYGILNGPELTQEEKIASDVDVFDVTANGRYVYYIKNYDDHDDTGTLYCYALDAGESVRVASEVACGYISLSDWDYGWTHNEYSTDGATVFYMKDLEDIGDTYSDHGTLMCWTYGSDSAQRIASEVLTYSVESGLVSGSVNKDSLMYLKYNSVDTDDNVYANWMYYNGTESIKVATDVIE